MTTDFIFKYIKELHSLNIPSILVKDFVSKLDKSNDSNFIHPLNIFSILITFEVLKLDKSIEIKLIHPSNILLIFKVKEVSKLDKSNEVKEEQFWNKFPIFNPEILFSSGNFIDFNFLQL